MYLALGTTFIADKSCRSVAPFFINDGYFNCDVALEFVKPGGSAVSQAVVRVHLDRRPVKHSLHFNVVMLQLIRDTKANGAYPGIGIIAPDSQPI